jgi:hypothetical protein
MFYLTPLDIIGKIILMSAALGLLLIIGQLNSFEFTPITSPQYAGESLSVTIIARDPAGGVYNYNRPAFLSTSRGAAYVYPNVIGPFRNGVWQGKVMITLADSLQLRCTDDSGQVTSSSNAISVLPGAPARFVIILPGQELNAGTRDGKLGIPDNQTAGDSFIFRVYLTDGWCNPVRFRNDSVYFYATDSFAFLPLGGEVVNGVGQFTAALRRAGQQWLFARPGAGQPFRSDTSSALLVNPGLFSQLLLLLPGEEHLPGDTASVNWMTPGKSGAPFGQFVHEPFSVKVYPCDRCWNRVTTGGLPVALYSEFAAEFQPAEQEIGDSAVFLATYFFPGSNQDIWVADRYGQYVSYRTRLEIKARGSRLEISAPDTVFAGETAYIRVVVRDANDQPVTAAVCRFAVVKGSGEMLDEALLTDTLGVAIGRFVCTRGRFSEFDTIRINSGTAESLISIYVNIPDSSLFSGRIIAFPNPFGFNQDATEIYYYLTRSSPIEVRIYDPFGNEVFARTFREGELGARTGINRIIWNGRNQSGRRVTSGVYLIQIIGQLHTGTIFRTSYRLGVVW